MSGVISGGSATVFGILYQVVGALHWATVELLNTVRNRNGEIEELTLILEPNSGGDMQVEASGFRIVEQWKTKRSKGKWSVREVVEHVIPNLCLAVNSQDRATKFCFVTNGAMADWSELQSLSMRIAEATEIQGIEKTTLSTDAVAPFYSRGKKLTDDEFVADVVSNVVQKFKKQGIAVEELSIRRKVLYTLANFVIRDKIDISLLTSDIDRELSLLVEHQEDVLQKRNELVGKLLKLSSETQTSIDPRRFLEEAGLAVVSLRDWARIRKNLHLVASDNAKRFFGFTAEHDVRPQCQISEHRCTVLRGESGSGKSWRLASIVKNLSSEMACVLVRATGSIESNLHNAAQILNYHGLSRERPIHFIPLCMKVQRHSRPDKSDWLYLLIDDVQNATEMRDLLDFDWESLGVRLAVSCSQRIAQGIDEGTKRIKVDDVGIFKQAELRKYLTIRNRNWRSIRVDVRHLIRMPQLAAIYCDVATEENWHPETEYELFQRAWNELRVGTRHKEHPGDMPALRTLAGNLAINAIDYPFQHGECAKLGMNSDAMARLERTGWLKLEEGRIYFAHTRLLNWAVAEYLSDRCNGSDVRSRISSVFPIVGELTKNSAIAGQNLGYVALDFLWLICAPNHPASRFAHECVAEIEAAQIRSYYPEDLFVNQLATIGPRIICALVNRIRNEADDGRSSYPALVARALINIAKRGHEVEIAAAASSFLDPSIPPLADCACRVLKVVPDRNCNPERIWSYYIEQFDRPGEPHPEGFSFVEPLEAMIAASKRNVEWLGTKIHKESRSTRLSTLGMLLWRVPDESADLIWHQHRSKLLIALQDDHRERSAAIERFRDRGATTQVLRRLLLLEDWQRSDILRAIAVVSPLELFDALENDPTLMVTRSHHWVLPLMNVDRERFNDAVYKAMSDGSDVTELYFQIYWRCPNDMSEIVLECATNALRDRCNSFLKNGADTTRHSAAISSICEVLCGVTSSKLLTKLRNRYDDLPLLLDKVALQFTGSSQNLTIYRRLEVFLLKIGGIAFTRYVNRCLRLESQMSRLQALGWASVNPDEETVALLRAQTLSDELYEHGSPKDPYLQRKAATILAEFGEHTDVVASILRHDGHVSAIAEARATQPPFSDDLCAPAWAATSSEVEETRCKGWHTLAVSGRTDIVPDLLRALDNVAPESLESRALLYALMTLNADTPAAIEAFSKQLQFTKNRWLACRCLLSSKQADVTSIFAAIVSRLDATTTSSSDDTLALFLGEFDSTKDLAAWYAWERYRDCPDRRTGYRDTRLIRLLGMLQSEEVHDFLYEEANPSGLSEFEHGHRLAAIQGLSLVDKNDAFEAAVLAFRESPHARDRLIDILLDLDLERAIPLLIDWISIESEGKVRRAIAVAVRSNAFHPGVVTKIQRLAASDEPRNRSIAAWLIGWLPPRAAFCNLQEMLNHECVVDVRSRILGSIQIQKNQLTAAELLCEIADVDVPLKWCIAECLFELLPPEMLGASAEDELWIFRERLAMPYSLRSHIASRFDHLMKNVNLRTEINDFLNGP